MLIANLTFSQVQKETIECYGKKYLVYLNFPDTSIVNTDSVFGLKLKGNNFKNFPKEVFKYKNLKYLEISNYLWSDVLDSLTLKEKEEFYRIKEKTPDGYLILKYYKTNYIRNIPKEIKSLKYLEFIDLTGAIIKNKRKFNKIYTYLPNVIILPKKEYFNGP